MVTLVIWAGLLVPLTIVTLLTVGAVFILGVVSVRKWLAGTNVPNTLHWGAALATAGAAGVMIAAGLVTNKAPPSPHEQTS